MSQTSRPPATLPSAAIVGLATLMALGAAALGVVLPGTAQPGSSFTLGLPAMIAIASFAEVASIDRRTGRHSHTLSLSEVALVIGLSFAAPTDVMLGRAIAGLVVYGTIRRIPARKLPYNTALLALEAAIAAAVYHALIGTRLVHEPAAWAALGVAVLASTVVGLGAVRGVLYLHGTRQRPETTVLSLAITAGAVVIGITGVVALSLHTAAAVLIAALSVMAFLAMRVISSLMDRASPAASDLHHVGQAG